MTASPSKLTRLARRLGWSLLLSGALVLLFAASFYLTIRMVFVGREVSVPDLAGLPVDQARAVLNRSDLYLETAGERYDDRVEKGAVKSQDPPAGATLKKNRKVRVVVSLGRLEVGIPDLRGQTLRTARIRLHQEGLSPGHVSSAYESSAPAGLVLAQYPPSEGASQATPSAGGGAMVDLLVSRGARQTRYVMPLLTGRRVEQAASFVRRAGLRLGAVQRERSSSASRGQVLRQAPAAGHPVGRQDIVTLVVSE